VEERAEQGQDEPFACAPVTLTALALLLAAAASHAFWNMLARASSDKLTFGTGTNVVSALALTPPALYFWLVDAPALSGLWFVAVVAVMYVGYYVLLSATYERADLSLSYPVIRGTSVVLVALGGYLFLGERVPGAAVAAVAVVALGIFIAHGGGWRKPSTAVSGSPLAGLLFAVLTGALIAFNTLWDKVAITVLPPVVYLHAGSVAACLGLVPYVLARRKAALQVMLRTERVRVVTCGLVSTLSYTLVLFALSFTPATYVATAREVSVLFGALFGVLLLHEAQGPRRILGATIILLGVVGLTILR
jgi:drug/metabolite transporter (DMT)-like permease